MLDEPTQKETMRARMRDGKYNGEIRELRKDVALELLALGRVELPEDEKADKASAGAGLHRFLSDKRR